MTGDELGVAAQRVRDGQVAAAVAAERARIAGELHALLADADAISGWLTTHHLGDAGPWPFETLAAYLRHFMGACPECNGDDSDDSGFEPEPSYDRHGDAVSRRKPLDAYPSDQTGPQTLLRGPQAFSTEES